MIDEMLLGINFKEKVPIIKRNKKEYDELQADLEKYKQQSKYSFYDVKMGKN
jgi:hypothetical protein